VTFNPKNSNAPTPAQRQATANAPNRSAVGMRRRNSATVVGQNPLASSKTSSANRLMNPAKSRQSILGVRIRNRFMRVFIAATGLVRMGSCFSVTEKITGQAAGSLMDINWKRIDGSGAAANAYIRKLLANASGVG